MKYNINKLKTSWTRYSIVQNLDLLYDRETLISIFRPEVEKDEPVIKAFLGMYSLEIKDIPEYWFEIIKFPEEKKLFGMFSLILTHHEVIEIFKSSSNGEMGGILTIKPKNKMYTNIRSSLVESGAAKPLYRRAEDVHYSFSKIFERKEIGFLFKLLLIDRLNRISLDGDINENNYYQLVEELQLYKCFGCDSIFFKKWLENDYIDTKNETYPRIKEVKINKFYSIEEEVELDFEQSNEIYFVGENGDGKSLILMAIYLAFNKDFIFNNTNQDDTGKIRDIVADNPSLNLSGMDTNGNLEYLNSFFAYGTHRGRFSAEKYEKYGFMTLFGSEETLISPEQWIKDQALLNVNNAGVSIDLIKETLFEILDRTVNIELKGTELLFEEKNKKELKFDQLSEGFKSITIFVVDLLFRLQQVSSSNSDIFKTSAVVIVDEIDLHLHPKWKKTIVSKLRSTFDNIQFIFTTHSPTIIQGASEDAIIFKVFRNEDGITRVTDKYYRKDLNNMMLNTLVTSSLFDLESARLDEDNDNADTSDNFLMSKIYERVCAELEESKKDRKFMSDNEIDSLIDNVLSKYQND
ncbi:DNA replication and repair protein RecF [Acinetobacter venetianus]|uniref:DNA replication and repair protein RecF n=1 Tax=Acinetobacter venetianus TaxID=52133 RepID=A0A150I1Z5_9GAMM|nr:AAA family ATPase [Acinetobacter venetianus]KXZ73402.1 DNA replication and repair protein RecF [Acinetobacter venetianus]